MRDFLSKGQGKEKRPQYQVTGDASCQRRCPCEINQFSKLPLYIAISFETIMQIQTVFFMGCTVMRGTFWQSFSFIFSNRVCIGGFFKGPPHPFQN